MDNIKKTVSEQLQDIQMLMHRAMHQQYREMHNPHRGQGRILAILKLKPEITQKELTFLLDMSKQSVAELISKLEKNGYITREQSATDKRVMIINLTEKGANTMDNASDNTFDIENKLDCFNEEELALFSEYLDRIISQFEDQFPYEEYEERRKIMEDFMSSYGHGFDHHQRHNGPKCHGRGRRPNHDNRRPSHDNRRLNNEACRANNRNHKANSDCHASNHDEHKANSDCRRANSSEQKPKKEKI